MGESTSDVVMVVLDAGEYRAFEQGLGYLRVQLARSAALNRGSKFDSLIPLSDAELAVNAQCASIETRDDEVLVPARLGLLVAEAIGLRAQRERTKATVYGWLGALTRINKFTWQESLHSVRAEGMDEYATQLQEVAKESLKAHELF